MATTILIGIIVYLMSNLKRVSEKIRQHKRKEDIIKQYEGLNETDKEIIKICCMTKTGEVDKTQLFNVCNGDLRYLMQCWQYLFEQGFFVSGFKFKMTKEYFDILKPHINEKEGKNEN